MNRSNPILEDYQLFLVYRNIGSKLLQQLRAILSSPAYTSFFKEINLTETNELHFFYLGLHFKTQIELYFNHAKMPKTALITTYCMGILNKKEMEEIVSYSYTIDLVINGIYGMDDFSENYLIEFHQNIKKSFSDHHVAFPIRLNNK